MAIYAEICTVKQWQLSSTIKLHADGNITYKTHWYREDSIWPLQVGRVPLEQCEAKPRKCTTLHIGQLPTGLDPSRNPNGRWNTHAWVGEATTKTRHHAEYSAYIFTSFAEPILTADTTRPARPTCNTEWKIQHFTNFYGDVYWKRALLPLIVGVNGLTFKMYSFQ
jgi:hypothetical protein